MVNQSTDSLVKYCDATTAEKVLTSQALRWSAPHLFSDPFELSYNSQLNFTQDDLLKATVRQAVNLIFSAETPMGNTPMLQAIRRWRSEDRFHTPEEAEQVLHGLLEQMVISRQAQIDQLMDAWRNYARRLRICSFFAKPDNLEAWQFFADNHRGVALRFRCGDDSSFTNPRKVTYQDTRPEITRLKDQLDAIVRSTSVNPAAEFANKFLTKPKAFAGQKEWRCLKLASEKQLHSHGSEEEYFSDVRFVGQDLVAIYFGVNTPESVQQSLAKLAKAANPKVRIFVGHQHGYNFELEFERLNPPAAQGLNETSQATL
ncbi:DUF2971 domain-containing protein [Halioxenophilus sp. WMMB6]|uniref:DUF2971 domain-containing protein n=1 Tax=Halioxenophilus sp. WMMB6 TaxID=3073815 RepID=UPI00295ECC3C|nr:DUF2971 domain-containing protein [Halioxenophilus sp. WMMB6]